MSKVPSVRFLLVCAACALATAISHDVESLFLQSGIGAAVFFSTYLLGRFDEQREKTDAAE